MNAGHLQLLSSAEWATYLKDELIPQTMEGVQCGTHLLEVGPGPGKTTDVLLRQAPHVTVVELDPLLAGRRGRPPRRSASSLWAEETRSRHHDARPSTSRRHKAALHTTRPPGACGGRRVSRQVLLRHKAAWWLDVIASSGA
jgi:hypothetical protein